MPATRIILARDIPLLGVEDPSITVRKFAPTLKAANGVFANLGCCLFDLGEKREMMHVDQSRFEGIYTPPAAGEALRLIGAPSSKAATLRAN
jgi:hypothetical protein